MAEATQAERKAIDRAEAFAKSKHTTPDEHDDIMVAVRLARLTAQSGEQQSCEPIATVEMIETVTGDFYTEPGEPIWRVMVGEYCADFDFEQAARNFASAINLAAQSGEGRSGAGEDDAGIAEKLAMRWRPIGRFASMPLDGTWFVARCTAPGYSAVRIVHYADRCDRLPIDHSGWVWPSAPTEWMPLDEFTAALNLTRSTALQTALEDICDPIAALRRYADERGRRLDGAVAFQLANDPNHLKGIARAALRATDDVGGAAKAPDTGEGE